MNDLRFVRFLTSLVVIVQKRRAWILFAVMAAIPLGLGGCLAAPDEEGDPEPVGQVLQAVLAAPSLTSPSNGATNQAVPVTLSWSSVSTATTYRVQVATSASSLTNDGSTTCPGTCVINATTSSTSYSASSLQTGVTYYWHVRAGNASEGGNWSQTRSFTTALPGLPAPSLSSPANGATGQQTSLTLSWSSVSGANTYRVQVATSQSALTTNDSTSCPGTCLVNTTTSSTSYALSGLQAGVTYYWHVRAGNTTTSQGGTWSQTRSFTTSLPGLPAPTLSSPANGATGQPTSLTLSWSSVSGANTYRVQVATSQSALTTDDSTSCPGTCLVNTTTSSTSYSLSGLQDGVTYYWHVRAGNTTTLQGGTWSQTRSFTTGLAGLPAPTLSSPANGATGQPTSLTLSWSSVSGANVYRVQVATSQSALTTDESSTCSGTCFVNTTTSSTSYAISGLQDGVTYYWHVRAGNTTTLQGGTWSQTRSFTTGSTGLPAPSLVSPANGATNQPTALALSWSSVSGANVYRVQLATSQSALTADDSNTCPGTCLANTTTSSTNYGVTGLQAGVTYYWHVRAGNTTTLQGGVWSTTRSFTTAASGGLAAPTLSSPANGSTNQNTSLSLSWSSVSGANTYRVQVASSQSALTTDDSSTCPGTCLLNTTTSGTTYSLSGLQAGTTYYWHVRAGNTTTLEGGVWSSTWSFATSQGGYIVSAPLIASPGDCATVAGTTSATLSWSVSSTAGIVSFSVDVKPATACNGSTTGPSLSGYPKVVGVASSQSTQISGLTDGSWYKYSIESTAGAGNTSSNTTGFFRTAGVVNDCGNGAIDSGELCDGGNVGGVTCSSLGFASGPLGCSGDCSSFDTSGCVAGGTCGNGSREPTEVCDGSELAGQTCVSQGYAYGGELGCNNQCNAFDESGCCFSIDSPAVALPTFGFSFDPHLKPVNVKAELSINPSSSDNTCEYAAESTGKVEVCTDLGFISDCVAIDLSYDESCTAPPACSGGTAVCDWDQLCCNSALGATAEVGKDLGINPDVYIPWLNVGASLTAKIGYRVKPGVGGSLNRGVCGCSEGQYSVNVDLALEGSGTGAIDFELFGSKVGAGVGLELCGGVRGKVDHLTCSVDPAYSLTAGVRLVGKTTPVVVGGWFTIDPGSLDIVNLGDTEVCQ